MDIDGQLRIVDRQGGAISADWIVLHNSFSYRAPGETTASNTQFLVSIHIVRPGQYSTGFAVPGTQVPFQTRLDNSIMNLTVFPKALAVDISSSDIPGASPGTVDAADLAALSQGLGKLPTYSYGGGCPEFGPGTWCWYTDLNKDGAISASDVTVLASDINAPECPDFAKVGNSLESTERILAWFGMAYSGRMINVGWTELPEVIIVDEAQRQRATLDPYGYRNLAASPADVIKWSRLKRLYK